MPLPSTSSVEDSSTGIFSAWSCLSCWAKTARGNPLAMTASGRSFTACFHAAWTLSGVPAVLICRTVQPTDFAAATRFLYRIVHDVTPQLMKSIRLPLGIGLPIGWVTGIRVGRWAHCAATLSAALTPALLPAESVLDEPLLLLPPQAPSARAETASRAVTIAARAARDHLVGVDVMGSLLVEGGVGWWFRRGRSVGGDERGGASAAARARGPRSRRGRRSGRFP